MQRMGIVDTMKKILCIMLKTLRKYQYFRFAGIVCLIYILMYILISSNQAEIADFQMPNISFDSTQNITVKTVRPKFQERNSRTSNTVLIRSIPVQQSRIVSYTSRIISREVAEKTSAYAVALTSKQRRVYQDIVLKLKTVLQQNGVEFFMYSGTLLGSYRHHDIIPWDDDVDILVNMKHRPMLLESLGKLKPFFYLNTYSNVRWKFFSIHSRPVKVLPWSWPFIDISFYRENSSHIWDSDPRFTKHYLYLKTDIFPLTRRPFMGMLLPAPKNTSAVLKYYKVEVCRSLDYSHRTEQKYLHTYKTDCNNLSRRHPFVKRHCVASGINETLVIGDKILKWFFSNND